MQRCKSPRARLSFLACLFASVLVATGCGSDASGSPTSDADDGALGMAGAGAESAITAGDGAGLLPDDPALEGNATVTVSGDFADFVGETPVEGVEVCVLDAEPAVCATSDADGRFALEVPADARVALATSRQDYQSAIFQFETAREDQEHSGLLIGRRMVMDLLLSMIGSTWDRSLGGVAAIVPGSDGVTPSLAPEAGDEPFYIVGATLLHSDTGSPAPGVMAIVNVESGVYDLSLTHASKHCEHQGWTTDLPDTQQVVVRPDHLTSTLRSSCL